MFSSPGFTKRRRTERRAAATTAGSGRRKRGTTGTHPSTPAQFHTAPVCFPPFPVFAVYGAATDAAAKFGESVGWWIEKDGGNREGECRS